MHLKKFNDICEQKLFPLLIVRGWKYRRGGENIVTIFSPRGEDIVGVKISSHTGTWTSGTDSTWTCRAVEEITVMVLFSEGFTTLGDSCTSRLAMYEWPVLLALSRLLSWWLGGDLRSGDARDEADDRDRRLPDDWWWRWCWEEEAEGRVSDALETLPNSARFLELEPPEELGRDRSSSRRLDEWCLGESCRLSAQCLRFRGPSFCLGSFGLGQPVAAGTLGGELKRIVRSVDFYGVVHGITFAGFLRRLRRSCGLASCLLSVGLGFSSPRLRQPILANETGTVLSTKRLPFIQAALLAAKMVVVSPSEMRTPGKLGLRFSWRRPVTWSLRHFVHAGTA